MTAFFAIMAVVCLLAGLPIAAQCDSRKQGVRDTAHLLLGVVVTLLIVGIVGCITTQSN